jgi:hypothetical protein
MSSGSSSSTASMPCHQLQMLACSIIVNIKL